ncbi:MAG: LptA/OstA family protein [bacterium]|nr:LptA/OstA family protein [bacterium]
MKYCPRKIIQIQLITATVMLIVSLAFPGLAEDGQHPPTDEPMVIRGKVMFFNADGSRSIKGDLVIVNGGSKITAKEGEYNQEKATAVAKGSVRVTEPGADLTCGELKAFLNENRNVAMGNPILTRITDYQQENGNIKRSKVVLKAEVIEILDGRKLIRATDRVRLTQEDITLDRDGLLVEGGSESSMVVCEFMEIFDDGSKMVAKGGVEVRSADFIATGERAEFYDSDQRMEIYGAERGDTAKAWQSVEKGEFAEVTRGEVRGRGHRIIYHGRDEILNIIGGARTWRKGERNFVEGEKIIHYVKDSRTVVLGGEGLYYSAPEEESQEAGEESPTGITGEEREFDDLDIYR